MSGYKNMEQKVNAAVFSGISGTIAFKGEGGVLRRWERKKGNCDEDKNEFAIYGWLFDHLEYSGKDYQQK